MSLEKKIKLYQEFGFEVAFASFASSAFRKPMSITRLKDKVLINYLKANFQNIIQKHKTADVSKKLESSNIIWAMWWQGEDNIPEIVKACFASIRRHCGTHEFKIITKENFHDYVDLPEHILQKADAGIITLTHLSDIIRFYLLSHYGGMWIDATFLVTSDIPDEIFEYDYYTVRHKKDFGNYCVSLDRWSTNLQAGKKNNPLCSFCYDFWIEYWKKKDILIDYVLSDYIIEIAYQELSECKRLLDGVPLNNPEKETLEPLLNLPFDSQIFESLKGSTIFFKLTYKQIFKKEITGMQTFYGKILEENL